MRTGIIYKICTGRNFVVGSTLHPIGRKSNHKTKVENGNHDNPRFQQSYDDNRNFEFVVLQENIPELILRNVEDIWIGALCSKISDKKNGLNIIDGTCMVFTEEIRKKKSEAQKRVMNSLSAEEKKGRSDKMAITKSLNLVEIGKNISKAKKNKNVGWENNQSYPVLQMQKSGEVIKLWPSAYQAEVEKGYLSSHIRGVCMGNYGQKTYKEYIWKYADEIEVKKYKHLTNSEVPECVKAKKNIPVVQKDKEGNIIKIWPNSRRLAEHLNVNFPRISIAISKNRAIDGFYFEFSGSKK